MADDLHIYMFKDMLMDGPGPGYLAEGVGNRAGWASNRISAHTQEYLVGPLREIQTSVKDLPGYTVTVTEFPVLVQSFAPMTYYDSLGYRRFDTIVSWKHREQELLRHNVIMRQLAADPSWNEIVLETEAISAEVIEAYLQSRSKIEELGDWSREQWIRFVSGHASSRTGGRKKGSRSPFFKIGEHGKPYFLKWDDILDTPRFLDLTYSIATVDLHKHLNDERTNYRVYAGKYLDPTKVGPAIRPREAKIVKQDELDRGKEQELYVLAQNQFSKSCIVRKWRGRKTGSQGIFSIEEWPIYSDTSTSKQHDVKRKCYEPFYTLARKLLPGVDLHFLVLEGLQFFINLQAEGIMFCGDLKNSEKQIGVAWGRFFPVATDLGHPEFDPGLSGELYSGRGDTGFWSEAMILAYIRVLIKRGYRVSKAYIYRDGVAFDIDAFQAKLPGLDSGGTIAGFVAGLPRGEKRFGPISWVSDSPDSRITYDIGAQPQRQVQGLQYYGRVMQAIATSDVAGVGECNRYLHQIADLAELKYIERPEELHAIMSKMPPDALDRIYNNNSLSAEFVKIWFYTQRTNNEQQTDLRTTNGNTMAQSLGADD